ncbi:MAG: hypothetical protein RBU21_12120 [FCB group bacterium]|jgi:hypothetical protein|nr:hypothetical protein [FCB group bacterium]
MVTIRCDGCGAELPKGALRYSVKIDVRAAYDELEVGLMDLVRDHRNELLRAIEALKDKAPRELEDAVYKAISLDLCPRCQRAFIHDPLHFRPGLATEKDFNIDDFLRSLGYGKLNPEQE